MGVRFALSRVERDHGEMQRVDVCQLRAAFVGEVADRVTDAVLLGFICAEGAGGRAETVQTVASKRGARDEGRLLRL